MKTLRKQAIEAIENKSEQYFTGIILRGHESRNHEWIEVYPSGEVSEAEEADNNTRHYISYPNKEVANVYDIHQESAEACNCDICKMYADFEDWSADDFADDYGQDIYDYCKATQKEEAILNMEHDNGKFEEGVKEEIIATISSLPYGYFDDENGEQTPEDDTEKKIYVSFHIGRGGHYNNPGHLTFVGEENFQDLISRCMDKCSIEDKKWNDDPTEEETILPDDEWTLIDNGGNVILHGRDEIEAMTGRLEWDTDYDTDYVTTTDSLSEKEEEVLWKAYTEDVYMSEELKDEICSLRWMKRVHDIKTYPTNLEVMTQDGVETIDIDQQKGLYDEDEWRSDLEDRRFCPFSVEMLLEELDRLDMFED